MKKNAGFTLVELMIAIAVLAVLVTVAIPSFRGVIKNNQATTQANLLVSSFNLARSEAIKRGLRVSVCSSTDQATCSGASPWETGWIVFTDATGTAGTFDGTDVIIRVQETLKGETTVADTGGATSVQYLSTGLVNAAASFELRNVGCFASSNRDISINATGRVSVTNVDC